MVFGKAGGFSADLNLSTLNGVNGFRIKGEQGGDSSGRSVASAGDFNGDGFDDLVIGADRNDAKGDQSGASYVVFGKAGGFTADLELATLNGDNGLKILGEAAGDYSGHSVAGAGDVNGDGLDDLIVGASGAAPNGSGSGASYVVFGSLPGESVTRIGSAIGQTIRGGAGDDTLDGRDGDDSLIGNGGDDVIIGGRGNDDLNGGLDDDTLSGGSGNDGLLGLSGADSLNGGSGNDLLNGGTGADRVAGGSGNDTYIVDASSDRLVEDAGNGTLDRVRAAADYRLRADVEIETLETINANLTTAIDLAGNEFGQTIIGNKGANTRGGGGNDVLTGGLGADRFVFDTAPGLGNIDRIAGFNVTNDTIDVENAIFTALGRAGPLAAAAFHTGAAAAAPEDRIIYNAATGGLFYDADGNTPGGTAAVRFATFSPNLGLTAGDFFVV